jgi:hypothetical protein
MKAPDAVGPEEAERMKAEISAPLYQQVEIHASPVIGRQREDAIDQQGRKLLQCRNPTGMGAARPRFLD